MTDIPSPPSLENDIRRIVVFGHTGFIGRNVVARLAERYPDVETIGLSLSDVDLTNPSSAEGIGKHLTPHTAVLMCAAIKRQLGDIPDIYLQNTSMLVNLANLITAHPVRRVVYLSSTSVYGEMADTLATTEDSPINPQTYYGLSKHTAEWMLAKVAEGQPGLSVGFVRPPSVYGPGDAGTTYGPSGFLSAARSNQPIALSGNGSDRREFVYIDDAVEMLTRYLFLDHSGPVNLVSGTSYTFQDAVAAIASATNTTPEVTTRDQPGGKVDITFDNTRLRTLMPDLAFTSLEDGIRAMCAAANT